MLTRPTPLQLCIFVLVVAGHLTTGCEGKNFTYDSRSVMINGERVLMLSGAVHYSRVVPEDWEKVILYAKQLGLNTIQTYVMWNYHEATEGSWRWDGNRNLRAFLSIVAKHNMYATVRIGPYVCAEYYYGGIPLWMREKTKCYRCSDEGWETNMKRVLSTVVTEIQDLLVVKSGPVVLLQVENEYNGGDSSYLEWAVDTARNLTTDVPWILCHDLQMCTAINKQTEKVLCTINGFWMDEYTKDYHQPSPKWMQDNINGNPKSPLIWTEDQGWFNQWGVAQRVRVSSDQLYGMARWFAFGGSWHNFYMLTGGNNYGLQSGGTVTTAYAQDTVVDYLLMKHEPRFSCYQRFFEVMGNMSSMLLSHPISPRIPLTPLSAGCPLTVSSCSDSDPAHPGVLDVSQQWVFNNGSIRSSLTGMCLEAWGAGGLAVCNESLPAQNFVLSGGSIRTRDRIQNEYRCLNETARFETCNGGPKQAVWAYNTSEHGFSSGKGCLTASQQQNSGCDYHLYGGLAFLSNTGDATETVMFSEGQHFTLVNQSVTIAVLNGSVWTKIYSTDECVDKPVEKPMKTSKSSQWKTFRETPGYGAVKHTSKHPLEQLNITNNDSDYMWYTIATTPNTSVKPAMIGGSIGYTHTTANETHILSCAMGLANTGVAPTMGKGVESASINNTTYAGTWVMSSTLEGEEKQIFNFSGSGAVSWSAFTPGRASTAYTWYQAEVQAEVGHEYALDLSSMWKGVAFVNGFHLGRYWMIPGACSGACAPPVKSGHCYMHWNNCGKPTQTLYHIPSSVVSTSGPNLITLFEETTPDTGVDVDPTSVLLLSFQ